MTPLTRGEPWHKSNCESLFATDKLARGKAVGAGNQDVNPAQEALVERLRPVRAARCSTDRAVGKTRSGLVVARAC